MGKIKRMDQIKMILQTYLATDRNIKATARRLQISKNTVRTYTRLGLEKYPDLQHLIQLPQEQFKEIFYPNQGQQVGCKKLAYFESKVSYYLKELARPGVTRKDFTLPIQKQGNRPSARYWLPLCHTAVIPLR